MPVPRADSERLRDSFLDILNQQALEASQLLAVAGDDGDVREAVAEILDRVQQTARSLHLEAVERVATVAARAVRREGGPDAVEALLAACRALDPTADVLRPVLLVGVHGASPDPLLRVAPTLDDALREARDVTPLALVAPVAQLGALRPDTMPGVPRYGWGEADDLAARLAAARAGATAYFAAPLDLRTLAARVRARALPASAPDRVLLVASDEAVAAAWVQALSGPSVELSVLRDREHLLRALDDVDPMLVALADARAAELVAVLRGHPDWWDLPRVVVTDAPAADLVELALPTSLPAERLRPLVLALLQRARAEREQRAQERGTGVLPRAALLRAAVRELSLARRTRQPLAVARVDLEEPALLRHAHGSAAVAAALRLLARALRDVVRTTDVIGRVGEHGFGVLLPGVTCDAVRARLAEVERRFGALAAQDPRLGVVRASAGVADGEDTAGALFQAADRDRLRRRRT